MTLLDERTATVTVPAPRAAADGALVAPAGAAAPARASTPQPLLGFLVVHAVLPALVLVVGAMLPIVLTLAARGQL